MLDGIAARPGAGLPTRSRQSFGEAPNAPVNQSLPDAISCRSDLLLELLAGQHLRRLEASRYRTDPEFHYLALV